MAAPHGPMPYRLAVLPLTPATTACASPLMGHECDLGAFERTVGIPAPVTAIVQLFDTQREAGAITGKGPEAIAMKRRLDALRNQLLTAGHYKNRNKTTDACAQLKRTFKQIDPDNTPDGNDLVTGSAAGQLADQVIALRADWLCE